MQEQNFRVGEWLVLAADNKISREGRVIALEPRLIDMLSFFAHHPDEVLSRDELIDNVWKRNIVTNHVVTQCISELRKSLKDGRPDAPEYIMTVPKRGYKLVEPVVWSEEGEDKPVTTLLYNQGVKEDNDVDVVLEDDSDGNIEEFTDISTEKPALRIEKPAARRVSKWIWSLIVLVLMGMTAALVSAYFNQKDVKPLTPILLNPKSIDVRVQGEHSCTNWKNQFPYAVSLSETLSQGLNDHSGFSVHDQTNFQTSNSPSNSGKTLSIEFVNQRHYRAQQCFLLAKLIDNADGSVMLNKRYFITPDNLVHIEEDLASSVFESLGEKPPALLRNRLQYEGVTNNEALQSFHRAHQLLIQGGGESLNKASALLAAVIRQDPNFVYARAEKALVDILLDSYQPLNTPQQASLRKEILEVESNPLLKNSAILQQIYTADYLNQGKVDLAFVAINKSIGMETSWLNYVLLGKLYELRGQNNLAADAYVTAFNIRPGANTLDWIKNGIFQTNLNKVVPYLANYEYISTTQK